MVVRLGMRVDMRRWLLVLCSIGVMGGGCSARALLSVGFTVEQGEEVTGTPWITVSSVNGVVRRAEDLGLVTVSGSKATRVGLYLDFEGDVQVSATLRAGNCDWTGTSSFVRVQRGDRRDINVVLRPPGPNCSAKADGGTDVDANASLLPDGSGPPKDGVQDTADHLAACIDYCNLYLTRCADWGAEKWGMSTCLNMCRFWNADGLSCRMTGLKAAVSPALRCSMCPLASPESPAMCETFPPDAGRDGCPVTLSDGGDF
jgi:hypothetical protein